MGNGCCQVLYELEFLEVKLQRFSSFKHIPPDLKHPFLARFHDELYHNTFPNILDERFFHVCMYGVVIWCLLCKAAQRKQVPVFCPSKCLMYTWQVWKELDPEGLNKFLKVCVKNVQVPEPNDALIDDDIAGLHTFGLLARVEEYEGMVNGNFSYLFRLDEFMWFPNGYMFYSKGHMYRTTLNEMGRWTRSDDFDHNYKWINIGNLTQATYMRWEKLQLADNDRDCRHMQWNSFDIGFQGQHRE